MKSELSVSITNIQSDVNALKNTVSEMEISFSTCTDDIVASQTRVEPLSAELVKVENKCRDLDARSQRHNTRIVDVPEDSANSFTTTAISTPSEDALKLDKKPFLDQLCEVWKQAQRESEPQRSQISPISGNYNRCLNLLGKNRWDYYASLAPTATFLKLSTQIKYHFVQ